MGLISALTVDEIQEGIDAAIDPARMDLDEAIDFCEEVGATIEGILEGLRADKKRKEEEGTE